MTRAGRHPESDIFLDDITVSRRHAEIGRRDDGKVVIRDVGSLNGTYVNRERIEEQVLSGRRRGADREVQAGVPGGRGRVTRRVTTRTYLSSATCSSLLREEFPDVTISKIRFLESQGLVNPERSPSGYRKFYEHDVERLRWVLRQQREHFLPLKVIRDRLAQEGGDQGAPAATHAGRRRPRRGGGRRQPVSAAVAAAGALGARPGEEPCRPLDAVSSRRRTAARAPSGPRSRPWPGAAGPGGPTGLAAAGGRHGPPAGGRRASPPAPGAVAPPPIRRRPEIGGAGRGPAAGRRAPAGSPSRPAAVHEPAPGGGAVPPSRPVSQPRRTTPSARRRPRHPRPTSRHGRRPGARRSRPRPPPRPAPLRSPRPVPGRGARAARTHGPGAGRGHRREPHPRRALRGQRPLGGRGGVARGVRPGRADGRGRRALLRRGGLAVAKLVATYRPLRHRAAPPPALPQRRGPGDGTGRAGGDPAPPPAQPRGPPAGGRTPPTSWPGSASSYGRRSSGGSSAGSSGADRRAFRGPPSRRADPGWRRYISSMVEVRLRAVRVDLQSNTPVLLCRRRRARGARCRSSSARPRRRRSPTRCRASRCRGR